MYVSSTRFSLRKGNAIGAGHVAHLSMQQHDQLQCLKKKKNCDSLGFTVLVSRLLHCVCRAFVISC